MSASPTLRQFAALTYALALARGLLTLVEMGEYEKSEVSRVLRGTSAANIAAALGLTEAEVAMDWEDYLSSEEMDTIRGGAAL